MNMADIVVMKLNVVKVIKSVRNGIRHKNTFVKYRISTRQKYSKWNNKCGYFCEI